MLPSFERVSQLAEQGNVIPVYKAVIADLLTPVSAFMKIAGGERYAFLLESIEGGEKIARYSFLGCNPFLIVRSRGNSVKLEYPNGPFSKKHFQETLRGNVIEVLRDLAQRFRPVAVTGLPAGVSLPPFSGGGVGYFAYDLVRLLERLPERAHDDLQLDDAVIAFYATLLAFDHVKHQILIISNIFLEGDRHGLREGYELACSEIARLEDKLNQPLEYPRPKTSRRKLQIRSNLTREQYHEIVRIAKEHIMAGDIFQVVLSQRFETECESDPLDIYRALRVINPSPYMFFLRLDDLVVTGASPEMLVKVMGRRLEYRPIAGTRRRGEDEAEDVALVQELMNDEKERAEHIMLVDLGRNDLGRVSEYGSVRVTDLMFVEKYSHVMHLVSALEARLRPSLDRFDALAACFPAGTVSGAPKVRAMEIIEELEPTRRGVYAGSIAYLDFSGNLDSCIALRTLVLKNGRAYIQAGGGIVADSTPEGEYQETVNKAMALVRAIELASSNFEL